VLAVGATVTTVFIPVYDKVPVVTTFVAGTPPVIATTAPVEVVLFPNIAPAAMVGSALNGTDPAK
jgi:hypothetical protein